MKLRDYVKNMKQFIKEHPEAADYDVVYASDEDGNSFHRVQHSPTIGFHEGNEFDEDTQPNAVCIN